MSQLNLDQMIELDVLERRRNNEKMVELKNAFNREGEETKSRNTDHQRFRDLNEETFTETLSSEQTVHTLSSCTLSWDKRRKVLKSCWLNKQKSIEEVKIYSKIKMNY